MTDSDTIGRTGDSDGTERGRRGRRDIVVPMRLYKTITVSSTLITVVGAVLGFVFLDAATLQVSTPRAVVTGALGTLGIGVTDGLPSMALAVVGLSIIAFDTIVYTPSTRFRAQGVGRFQEDSGGDSNNG